MSHPPGPSSIDRRRLLHLRYFFGLALLIVVVQFFRIQIVRHEYYVTYIDSRVVPRPQTLAPPPGAIYTSDSEILADSVILATLNANPQRMLEREGSFKAVARSLAPLVDRDADELAAELEKNKSRRHLQIKRWLDAETADRIRKLEISGLNFVMEWKRQYPQGKMACHIIGGRSKDHIPTEGLELRHRLLLDGRKGQLSDTLQGAELAVAGAPQRIIGAVEGKDIVLTLNAKLQRIVETEIDQLWAKERPMFAYAVVMNPQTGEILAMSTRPNYDPNDLVRGEPLPGHRWSAVPASAMGNLPVTSQIEPGSTFKILLAAAALDAKVATPATRFHCGGQIQAGGRPIRCWGRYATEGHGTLDLGGMLAQSCNIYAAQLVERLGSARYREFLSRAGIGSQPQAGFSGEATGMLTLPVNIHRRDLMTTGIGQNISLSAVQLTSIVGGLVNDGVMMSPHILKSVKSKDGQWLHEVPPQPQVRLCSEETSRLLNQMLENVVERGTGRPARIEGVRVGGKTGTAQQWDPETGRHHTDRFTVSFILTAPADHPRFVIYIVADDPKVGRHGSDVAAPVARRIAEYALRQLPAQPDSSQ